MPKTMSPELECDKPCSLLIKTRRLLKKSRRSVFDISKDSGLPFYWLLEFKNKTANGGSVNRVQFLYEFLSDSKLFKK